MCCCCVQRLPASPDGCWRGCSPPAVVVVDADVRCWVCRSPRLAREGSPLLGDLVGLLSLGLGLAGLLDLGPAYHKKKVQYILLDNLNLVTIAIFSMSAFPDRKPN